MRLCNYRLMNAIVFLIKMLFECNYTKIKYGATFTFYNLELTYSSHDELLLEAELA